MRTAILLLLDGQRTPPWCCRVPPSRRRCRFACAAPTCYRAHVCVCVCVCRHFAEKQFTTDRFGTTVGALVYLSLLPSLRAAGRHDLMAEAIACAALCLWPLALTRLGYRAFYVRHRDTILLVQ